MYISTKLNFHKTDCWFMRDRDHCTAQVDFWVRWESSSCYLYAIVFGTCRNPRIVIWGLWYHRYLRLSLECLQQPSSASINFQQTEVNNLKINIMVRRRTLRMNFSWCRNMTCRFSNFVHVQHQFEHCLVQSYIKWNVYNSKNRR